MRPFWLLAPKPPRKYPLVDTSPNFGLAGDARCGAALRRRGGGRRRERARLLGLLGLLGVVLGVGVLSGRSAKAWVDPKPVAQ